VEGQYESKNFVPVHSTLALPILIVSRESCHEGNEVYITMLVLSRKLMRYKNVKNLS
jgi:hypothetical protein